MKGLQQLINQRCPNGVEWKTLGEVAKVKRGDRITKKDLIPNGKYPVMSGGTCFFGRYSKYNRCANTITVAQYGSAGFVSFVTEDFWANDVCYSVFPLDIIVNKYLYYCLVNNQQVLYSLTTKAIPDCLPQNRLESLQIPLPPLAIQSRIVEILDHFTNLTANLTAELALRRKQFEHMLDVYFGINEESMIILASKKGIEIKELQDLGTLTRGRRFVRDDIRTKGVPCIHYGDMYTTYGIAEENTITFLDEEKANKLRFAEPNDVVIVGAGENDWDIGVGLAWFGKEKVVVHDACYIYKHSLNPKFVSYYLRSNNYHLQIRKWVSSGKISAISDKNLGKAKIPLYNADVQQTIVEQLDKFTALIQNIENELALRQKQYEYYREKLLSFPSPSL